MICRIYVTDIADRAGCSPGWLRHCCLNFHTAVCVRACLNTKQVRLSAGADATQQHSCQGCFECVECVEAVTISPD